jgi:streptomycin 6-kinase
MQYLQWMRGSEDGRARLDSLPDLVEQCANKWLLTLGDPFPSVYTSFVVPAKRGDGTDVVLKIGYPHRETEHEGLALEV